MMGILKMMMLKVDPFAVYAAERELAAHGHSVPREVLVAHYLVLGQLRTAVQRITDNVPELPVEAAMSAAVVEGPDESDNPKFVSPICTGFLYCGLVLLPVGVVALSTTAAVSLPVFKEWRWVLAVALLLATTCFGYAFLGSRWGARESPCSGDGVLRPRSGRHHISCDSTVWGPTLTPLRAAESTVQHCGIGLEPMAAHSK